MSLVDILISQNLLVLKKSEEIEVRIEDFVFGKSLDQVSAFTLVGSARLRVFGESCPEEEHQSKCPVNVPMSLIVVRQEEGLCICRLRQVEFVKMPRVSMLLAIILEM